MSRTALALWLVLASSAGRPPVGVSFNASSEVPHDGDPTTDSVTITLRPRSRDPDGEPVSHLWHCPTSQTDTAKLPAQLTALTADFRAGEHQCELVAADSTGASTTGLVRISVRPEANRPPEPSAGLSPPERVDVWRVPHDGSPRTELAAVVLDGSNSTDPDGDQMSFAWRCDGELLGEGLHSSVITASLPAGTHTCELTATDSYGAARQDSVEVPVLAEANQPPVADAGPDQEVVVPHDEWPAAQTRLARVVLDGRGTADPEGDLLSHQWECNEATSPSSAQVALPAEQRLGEHGDEFRGRFTDQPNQVVVMLPAGEHECTLVSTDTYGASSSDAVHVVVLPEPNESPRAGQLA